MTNIIELSEDLSIRHIPSTRGVHAHAIEFINASEQIVGRGECDQEVLEALGYEVSTGDPEQPLSGETPEAETGSPDPQGQGEPVGAGSPPGPGQ